MTHRPTLLPPAPSRDVHGPPRWKSGTTPSWADASPSLRVTIVVKGLLGRAGCTRMVQGGYNAGLTAPDSLEAHLLDTFQGGGAPVAFTRLILDPTLRERLGRAGRRTVVARYSVEGNWPLYLRAVQDAMSGA